MHEISAAVKVTGPHRRDKLFERLQDLESFPRWMNGMMAVQMLRRSGERALSRWAIEVHGCPVGWVQEDHFDVPQLTYRFDGREGDFEFLTGAWSVRPEGDSSLLVFESRWDLGVPVIEDLLGRSVETQMSRAASNLLEIIRAEAERTPLVDSRIAARRPVRLRAGISAEGARGLGRITDISRTGARLSLGGPLLTPGQHFVLLPGNERLPKRVPARVAWVTPDGTVGVTFDEALSGGPIITSAR